MVGEKLIGKGLLKEQCPSFYFFLGHYESLFKELYSGSQDTYHHLQGLLGSDARIVCGHLSKGLLKRLHQKHHRRHHGHYTEHQTTAEPGGDAPR